MVELESKPRSLWLPSPCISWWLKVYWNVMKEIWEEQWFQQNKWYSRSSDMLPQIMLLLNINWAKGIWQIADARIWSSFFLLKSKRENFYVKGALYARRKKHPYRQKWCRGWEKSVHTDLIKITLSPPQIPYLFVHLEIEYHEHHDEDSSSFREEVPVFLTSGKGHKWN